MQNIIRNPSTVEQLAESFSASAPVPLLPPLGSAAWDAVASNPVARNWISQIRDRALQEEVEPLPILTDELYADFHRTGNRLPFEQVYFERRRRLARAAISALTATDLEIRGRFVLSTLAKAADIFAEEAWAMPAHVTVPSGKDPMKIDLFAAETANLFAELVNLFPDQMAGRVAAIDRRLRTQFFENYLEHPPEWTAFHHNWNAVCHQGVLGAALALCDDTHLLGRLFSRAAVSLKIFLDGFSGDGGSSEGVGYWGYGFGWFAELNNQLEARTQGRLSFVGGDRKARSIAAFGPTMTLSNGFCVNFSDNSARSTPRASLLTYLGDRFDDIFIRDHAALAWQRSVGPLDLNFQRTDLFFLTRQLLRCPHELGAPVQLPDTDTFLPGLGVFVIRFRDAQRRLWEFSAKAGHNAEHHNHNDLGGYILNIDGRPMLTDIGQPEYVRDFFGPGRYTFLAARSLGHPVPLIGGQEQSAGKEFHASVLRHELSGSEALIEIDLTGAYPAKAGCTRCVRQFRLDKRAGRLVITDTFSLSGTGAVETAVITASHATVNGSVVTIVNDEVSLRIAPGPGSQIREVRERRYSGHEGQPAAINRIVLTARLQGPQMQISCTIDLD